MSFGPSFNVFLFFSPQSLWAHLEWRKMIAWCDVNIRWTSDLLHYRELIVDLPRRKVYVLILLWATKQSSQSRFLQLYFGKTPWISHCCPLAQSSLSESVKEQMSYSHISKSKHCESNHYGSNGHLFRWVLGVWCGVLLYSPNVIKI